MNASHTIRIALPVLTLIVAAPLTAKADPYDRAFDSIERYADISADRARHAFSDILHDVHDRNLRAEMSRETQRVMSGFMQIRVLARAERVDRMSTEVHKVIGSLNRLDRLVHAAEDDEHHAHHGAGPDIHHIHKIVVDLTKRAQIIDDMVHDLQGPPPVRYEAGYRSPRPVTSRGRPSYQPTPSGVRVGGRGFSIEFGDR